MKFRKFKTMGGFEIIVNRDFVSHFHIRPNLVRPGDGCHLGPVGTLSVLTLSSLTEGNSEFEFFGELETKKIQQWLIAE